MQNKLFAKEGESEFSGMGGDQNKENAAAFARFQSALRSKVGEAKFKSWFLDLGLAERGDRSVTFSTGSQAKCDMLDNRYIPVLAAVWSNAVAPVDKVRLMVRKNLLKSSAKVGAIETSAAKNPFRTASTTDISAPLDPRRTFDTYAVGHSNQIAWAAARQALDADKPRDIVYFYGPSGSGKTHLGQAVGHEWRARFEDSEVAYITYRNLINACVNAVLSGDTQRFHETLLGYDLIILDDIHFLEGKERTQEELLVVIDAALDRGKQVVIAGDLPPAKLAEAGIKKRLTDRLAGGLCVPIHEADEALRLEILKKRVRRSAAHCLIEDDVLEFIARTFTQSTRETIGALNQLFLMYGGEEKTVILDEAKAVLKSRMEDRKKIVTIDDAIAAGAEAFGLTLADITGRAQPQRIAKARHAVVFCAREVLKESFPRIGKALKRDHTTVMSSYRRAQALLERDKVFQAAVARIREALED